MPVPSIGSVYANPACPRYPHGLRKPHEVAGGAVENEYFDRLVGAEASVRLRPYTMNPAAHCAVPGSKKVERSTVIAPSTDERCAD